MAKKVDRNLLICPACGSANLSFSDREIICSRCGEEYSIQDGNTYCFIEQLNPSCSFQEKLKGALKCFPMLYSSLIQIVSPVCPTGIYSRRRFLKDYLKNNPDAVIINLGSGVSDFSNVISNIDIFAYPNVNLTCDIKSIPFKNESVDLILNIAVLEHVPDPEKVVEEIFRILKPGGMIYCFFPFMQGFHAAPFDFSRRTVAGLRYLFREFRDIEVQNAGGPTSALLWILEEWIALVLSFGILPLYNLIHLVAMALLWPFKFLDFVLIRHPKAQNISSGYVLIATK